MTFILPSFGASAIAAVPGGGGFANDYSVDFDGTDDNVSTGLDVGGASALTVSAWVKHDSVANAAIVSQYVGSGNRAFRLSMYPNTASWAGLRLDAYNSSNTNFGTNYLLDPVISAGVWYHAAFVFTGSAITVYYNGNASPTVSMTGVLDSVTRNVDIGSSGGSSEFMDGKIDEVGVWTSALSASDITAIYNSGVPADISAFNPVGYWRMGDSDTGVSNGSSTPTIVSNVANSSAIQNHYALDFDGSNDYLSLGNLGTAGRSLGSMLFWVNITSTNGIHSANLAKFLVGFGGAGGGFYWGYWGTNTDLLTLALHSFNRRTRFNAPSAGDKLTAGWHLIGVNHNGTSYDIIIDGVTAPNATLNSGSTGSYSIQNATSIISGTDFDDVKVMTNTAGSYASEGLVDEFAIWDSALSSSDITAIYNSGVPADLGTNGLDLSPQGWWRMGDGGTWNGSNWSIPDASANSNTGTTANMVEADRATDTPTANAILKNGPTYSDNVPT